jgi:hypothetical protein
VLYVIFKTVLGLFSKKPTPQGVDQDTAHETRTVVHASE